MAYLAGVLQAARGFFVIRRAVAGSLSRTVPAALLLVWAASCFAADAGLLESRVKAAFLYKFADYVEWPDSAFAQADTPITIAVVGADTVATELGRAVEGRKVDDRAVIVKRLRPGDALSGVHILFVGSGAVQPGSLLQAARSQAILTVTEVEGALTQGSVINFIVVDRRVRFEISRDSANKNRLRLSSRLLAVAQHVTEGP
jgi:hypothetical protein